MFNDGFKRAKAMFAAIAAAMALPSIDQQQAARAKIGAYRSRGHGRGNVTYAHGRGSRGGNNAGRGIPHQGVQERLRRARGGWAAGWNHDLRLSKREAVWLLQDGTPFDALARA